MTPGNNAARDVTTIAVVIRPVPTLSKWSLIVPALLLGLLGWRYRDRRSSR